MIRFTLLWLFINFQVHAQQTATPDMLENVLSGVVTVAVYQQDIGMKPMGFRGSASEAAYAKVLDLGDARGSGSGFIIRQSGKWYVVTNAHVVQSAAAKKGSLYVYTVNHSKYEARLIGGDTFYDIAVLEFLEKPGAEISALEFKENEPRVGERVFAVGNPLGDYPYTVSDGIISAKNRVRDGLIGKFGFLQTTATVIWGNSGGPLVDAEGRVCGINSQIAFTELQGSPLWLPQINFALEPALCKRLVSDIISNNGLVKRAFLGVEIARDVMNPIKAKYYYALDIAGEYDPSVRIRGTVPESPADAVLKKYVGYRIDSLNGEVIRSEQEALAVFEKTKPGEVLRFNLSKGSESVAVAVKATLSNMKSNASIGEFMLAKWGCGSLQAADGMQLRFVSTERYASFQKTAKENIRTLDDKKSFKSELLFSTEWNLVVAGIYENDNKMFWRVKDLADLGSILRLCGSTGGIDLVLIKRGSDPANTDNYVLKRFLFSGNDDIYTRTLWY